MRSVNQTKCDNKGKWLYHRYYRARSIWFRGPNEFEDEPWTWNLRCFRAISTTQERRYSCLMEDEKEYGIRVRGRRQGHSLPEAWDDYTSSACYAYKSWKHNSKRKTQWKYE